MAAAFQKISTVSLVLVLGGCSWWRPAPPPQSARTNVNVRVSSTPRPVCSGSEMASESAVMTAEEKLTWNRRVKGYWKQIEAINDREIKLRVAVLQALAKEEADRSAMEAASVLETPSVENTVDALPTPAATPDPLPIPVAVPSVTPPATQKSAAPSVTPTPTPVSEPSPTPVAPLKKAAPKEISPLSKTDLKKRAAEWQGQRDEAEEQVRIAKYSQSYLAVSGRLDIVKKGCEPNADTEDRMISLVKAPLESEMERVLKTPTLLSQEQEAQLAELRQGRLPIGIKGESLKKLPRSKDWKERLQAEPKPVPALTP